MGTDRYIHGEMNIDFTLWSSDEDYCVRVPRLKKASNRVQSKITTAKTGLTKPDKPNNKT